MRGSIFLTLVFSLAALGASTARVELPDGFDPTAVGIRISGIGGRNEGTFQFAEYRGEYARSESRLGLAGSKYVQNRGGTTFTLRAADAGEIATANCRFTKEAVTIGAVTFDVDKLLYRCEFVRDGALLDASFVVGHPKADGLKAKILAMELRRGESNVLGQRLDVESIHRYQGSKFQSPSAVGYRFSQDGKVVAVLDLTDVSPMLFVATDASAGLRDSAVAAALPLALWRDPANSALED